jgi:hypothetical protein
MQVGTRKQAIETGAKTYYTGQPCKNQHVAERYTVSGGCKECITESVNGIRRAVGGPVATPERLEQAEGLTPMRLRIVPADVATLLDTVVAMTLARRPLLVATDVVGARKGTKPEGGTLLFIVNVDAQDVELIRQMQWAMLKVHTPDPEAERRRIFGALAAQAEAGRDNGETEWDFK